MISNAKKSKKKKDKKPKDVTPREFPGPHGPMISKNPDLGSGPYSQNNGKPYGGIPAGDFIKKWRKRRKGKDAERSASAADINSIEKLSIEFYNRCMNVKESS